MNSASTAWRVRLRSRLNKPEYWFQPSQVAKRLQYSRARYSDGAAVRISLPWGVRLTVNPLDTIGKSLITQGVYDLCVSETLWRLTDPGDGCLDVGANIGYMTALFATRAAPGGEVFSFEPHPSVFKRLQKNLGSEFEYETRGCSAPIFPSQLALGNFDGEAELIEPDGFNENESSASLATAEGLRPARGIGYRVTVRCLDSLFRSQERFGVAKVDVEGAELAVFEGAERLLSERRIRDVIFEDFGAYPSACADLLFRHAYKIFRLTKTILGPVLRDPADNRTLSRGLPWEPVNYLATADPLRAQARLSSRGWLCLKRKSRSNCKLLSSGNSG